jgi:L-malate glycosyltransferase
MMTSQVQRQLARPRLARRAKPLHVCQIISADLWAGAEVQVAAAASYLVEREDIRLTAVLFNDGWLARELDHLGVETCIIDEQRHGALRIVTALTEFLNARDIDVVHTHRCKDNVLGSAAAKLAGVPVVIRTVHGLAEPMRGWDRAKYLAYDALDKLTVWSCADRVVAVSHATAEILQRSGYRRRTVTTIHNGADLRRVHATLAPPADSCR